MKILKADRKNNLVHLIPENFDDLWHIEKIIEKGDIVSGSSERKIKPRNEGEKPFKQKIFVELEAEKAEFHETTNQLRITGKIISATPEQAAEHGASHTLESLIGEEITIRKKALKNYHIERLERARSSSARGKLALVIMDDEEAEIALLKDSGAETKARILSGKSGKRYKQEETGGKYFDEIAKKLRETNAANIVVAGPGFEKQAFEKFLKTAGLGAKLHFETTSSVGKTGINELVKSGKIDKLISGIQSAQESQSIERLLAALGNDMASIGDAQILEMLGKNAVDELLINEKMLSDNRQTAEQALDLAEQSGAKIQFISKKSDAGKSLEGMGGIAAILRYRTKW